MDSDKFNMILAVIFILGILIGVTYILIDSRRTTDIGYKFCSSQGYDDFIQKTYDEFCEKREGNIIIRDEIEKCGKSFCFIKEGGK